MKIILVMLFMCFSLCSYSQEKLFNKFDLGVDSYESLCKKNIIIESNFGSESNFITEYDGKVETINITYDGFEEGDITLRLVDNKLLAIKFYPRNDKIFNKYSNFLKSTKSTKDDKDDKVWVNSRARIIRDIVIRDGKWLDYFIYYDKNLYNKYYRYREF